MNLVDVDLDGEGAVLGGRSFPLPRATMARARGRRVEDGDARLPARVGARSSARARGFPFEVVVVEELGSDAFAYGTHAHLPRRRGRQADHAARRRPQAAHEGRRRSTSRSTRTRRTSSPPRAAAGSPATPPPQPSAAPPGRPGLTARVRPGRGVPPPSIPGSRPGTILDPASVRRSAHAHQIDPRRRRAILGAVAVLTGRVPEQRRWRRWEQQHEQEHRGHVRASPTDQETGFKAEVNKWAEEQRRHRQVHPDQRLQLAHQHPGAGQRRARRRGVPPAGRS